MSDQTINPPNEPTMSAEQRRGPVVPPVPPGIFRQSPYYRIVFSNFFKIRVGPGDLSIVFSAFADVPGNPSLVAVQDEVSVGMAWSQLKSLSETLSLAIKTIEDQVGPIPTSNRGVPSHVEPLVRQTLIGYGFSKSTT